MKILNLNTYITENNLSFPHYQMHKELIQLGHDSVLLGAKGDLNEENIILLNRGGIFPYFGISRIVRKIVFEMFYRNKISYYYPEWNLDGINLKQITSKIRFKPDIIIAYWTKFAFNFKLLYELSEYYNAPVVIYLMDMAPLTGGCHYAYDCQNYTKECGKCMFLKSSNKNDLSNITWKIKKKYIDMMDLTLISGSTTLSTQIQNSSLFKNKKCEMLIAGVDTNIFKPSNKAEIKRKYSIDDDKKIIFFGAASLDNFNKGMTYLVDALNELNKLLDDNHKENVLLIIAGNKFTGVDIPFNFIHLGYLESQEELADVFRMSDVFVCPSIEDSGPIMINLSISTGCPVVSFKMGVAPDLVINDKTGYVAKLKDSSDLAYGLKKILLLEQLEWQSYSDNARALGVKLCSKSNRELRISDILNNVLI